MRMMLNWTLDVLFSKDLVQFRTVRSQTIAGLEELEEHFGRTPTEEVPVH